MRSAAGDLRSDAVADRDEYVSDPGRRPNRTVDELYGSRSCPSYWPHGPLSNDNSLGAPLAPHALGRVTKWDGMSAEIVHAARASHADYSYRGRLHLLVLFERVVRREGRTRAGELVSCLHDASRKFVFVPAGCAFHNWHVATRSTRMVYLYIDPDIANLRFKGIEFPCVPLMMWEDPLLLSTVQKLTGAIESVDADNGAYLEALGAVLVHEICRPHRHASLPKQIQRGGLAAWQQRAIISHVEAHLAEPLSLRELAALAGLSTSHFCRAFKQSVGMPPHRYHTHQRIERAKALLATRALSVTEIGLVVGFSETSSFTAAFRKSTGLTPSAYYRSLV